MTNMVRVAGRAARFGAVRRRMVSVARAAVARAAYRLGLDSPAIDLASEAFANSGPHYRSWLADDLQAIGYRSQIGQDVLIDRHIFAGRRGGVFVDVGAHAGVALSNTFFLEQERGWSGVCIEPNPDLFPQLQSARTARCIPAAIGPTEGSVPFRVVTGEADVLSGIETAYDRRHRVRLEHERARLGSQARIIDVPMRRLDTVLREAGIDRVDFLSIDVEGAEAGVLDSIDLRAFDVGAVIIENNYRSWSIPRRFRRQRYQLLLRIGWDELYVPNPARLP
jgi:FkbM family methyltransferase